MSYCVRLHGTSNHFVSFTEARQFCLEQKQAGWGEPTIEASDHNVYVGRMDVFEVRAPKPYNPLLREAIASVREAFMELGKARAYDDRVWSPVGADETKRGGAFHFSDWSGQKLCDQFPHLSNSEVQMALRALRDISMFDSFDAVLWTNPLNDAGWSLTLHHTALGAEQQVYAIAQTLDINLGDRRNLELERMADMLLANDFDYSPDKFYDEFLYRESDRNPPLKAGVAKSQI